VTELGYGPAIHDHLGGTPLQLCYLLLYNRLDIKDSHSISLEATLSNYAPS
jgi:hypothetical protein